MLKRVVLSVALHIVSSYSSSFCHGLCKQTYFQFIYFSVEMIAEIFLSYFALTQQGELEPQWNYIQKILDVYACSGDPTWTDRISDVGTRGVFKLIEQFLCNDTNKEQIKGDKEYVQFVRDLDRKSNDFECFKRAYFSFINRLLCTKPVVIYDVVSRLIDDQYRHYPSEDDNNRNSNMVCVFLRYYMRLQIRNEFFTLFQTLNACPRITSRNAVRSRHRVKRQFDLQSLIFFWKSLLDNQSGLPDSENTRNLIEQILYIAGPVQHCVISLLTKSGLRL